jgi:rubrerythrin
MLPPNRNRYQNLPYSMLDRMMMLSIMVTTLVTFSLQERSTRMAVWNCSKCGYEKESRCKPKKCPTCAEAETFVKK